MNWKRLGLIVVLADFVALTAYAVYQHGYVGFFEFALANSIGVQLFTDLVIALSLFSLWMFRDARERGISPLPYFALILTLGSIGALAYLIRRTGDERVAMPATTQPRVAVGASR
jgi:drug/metabolite transporter (DMT)-like permease